MKLNNILIILIILMIIPVSGCKSNCCKPRTGFDCEYCPGISDNECESWLTDNEGKCVKEKSQCPENYKVLDISCDSGKICCVPTDFDNYNLFPHLEER